MVKKITKILSSYSLMALLITLFCTAIAAATFIESYRDATSARAIIYNSWWFIATQIVMVTNFIAITVRRNLFKQRKFGALLLHLGLIIVLGGALTTHIWGSEGIMTIREGSKSNTMLSSDTYLTVTAKKDDKIATKELKVNYGAAVEDNFDFTLKLDTNLSVRVKYLGFIGEGGNGALNIEVSSNSSQEQIAIRGGKYMTQPALIINLDGIELQLNYGSITKKLPFTVALTDFELTRYPGSSSPSSYSSDVEIEHNGKIEKANIYMNNIAYVGSYRLYQTSYDKDEKGTILTVNHDLIGTIITYIGYLALAFGLILSLLHRGSRFETLLRRLKEISAVAVLFTMLSISNANAANSGNIKESIIDKELATEFSKLLVQNPNGRVEPLNSYALKIARKLHRSSNYKGYSAEQMLLGIISSPYIWSNEPLLYIGNKQLAAEFNALNGKYISYNSLFSNDGSYKILGAVERIHSKPTSEQSKYEKEVLKIDEKANILNALFNGNMLRLFPIKGDQTHRWLSMGEDLSPLTDSRDSLFVSKMVPWFVSEALDGEISQSREVISMIKTYQKAQSDPEHQISERKVDYEIFYNNTPIFKQSAILYLIFGAIMLSLLLTIMLRNKENKNINKIVTLLTIGIVVAFLWQTFGIALRWYISGRAPWTNSYESMIYVGWSATLLGLIFVRRSKSVVAIAALMAGAIMMISQLNLMDPEITPLVPVLKSYWLMFHVATITASYGFFAVTAMIGLTVLILFAFTPKDRYKLKIEELSIINELAMTIGLVLLTIGIFIGAVWANESWGRYWGWDPKESWALITMMVYALVLHMRFIPSMRGKYIFNVMALLAIYTVLMTFFGVNYYLTGMHSYGNINTIAPLAFIIPTAVVVAIIAIAYRNSD